MATKDETIDTFGTETGDFLSAYIPTPLAGVTGDAIDAFFGTGNSRVGNINNTANWLNQLAAAKLKFGQTIANAVQAEASSQFLADAGLPSNGLNKWLVAAAASYLDPSDTEGYKARGTMAADIGSKGVYNNNPAGYSIGARVADNLYSPYNYSTQQWGPENYNRYDYAGFSKGATSQLAQRLAAEEDYFSHVKYDGNNSQQLDRAIRDFQQTVQKYAKALEPLKGIFGNDMAKIINTLEQITGQPITTLGAERTNDIARKLTEGIATGKYTAKDIALGQQLAQGWIEQAAAHAQSQSVSQRGTAVEQSLTLQDAVSDKLSPYATKADTQKQVAQYVGAAMNSNEAALNIGAVTRKKDNIDAEARRKIADINANKDLSVEEKNAQIKKVREAADAQKAGAALAVQQEIREWMSRPENRGLGSDVAMKALYGVDAEEAIRLRASDNYHSSVAQGQRLAVDLKGDESAAALRKDISTDGHLNAYLQNYFGLNERQATVLQRKATDRLFKLANEDGGTDLLNISDPAKRLEVMKQARDSGRYKALEGLSDLELEAMSKTMNMIGEDTQHSRHWTEMNASKNIAKKAKEDARNRAEEAIRNKIWGNPQTLPEKLRDLITGQDNSGGAKSVEDIEKILTENLSASELGFDPNSEEGKAAIHKAAVDFKLAKEAAKSAITEGDKKRSNELQQKLGDAQVAFEDADKQLKDLEAKGLKEGDAAYDEAKTKRDQLEKDKDKAQEAWNKQYYRLQQKEADTVKRYMDAMNNPVIQSDETYMTNRAEYDRLASTDTSKMSATELAEHKAKMQKAESSMQLALKGQGASAKLVGQMQFYDDNGVALQGAELEAARQQALDEMNKTPARAYTIAQRHQIEELRDKATGDAANATSDEEEAKALKKKALYEEALGNEKFKQNGIDGLMEWETEKKEAFKGEGKEQDREALKEVVAELKAINEKTASSSDSGRGGTSLIQTAVDAVLRLCKSLEDWLQKGNGNNNSVENTSNKEQDLVSNNTQSSAAN